MCVVTGLCDATKLYECAYSLIRIAKGQPIEGNKARRGKQTLVLAFLLSPHVVFQRGEDAQVPGVVTIVAGQRGSRNVLHELVKR